MNLDELQSIRDRERQSDSLQQLRESFYEDVGAFIQSLRDEREAAAARADDPFDSPEVNRLTDDIKTAEQTVEAIYERRVGKLVKMASFAAADMPTEDEGLTAEERDLFDQLVAAIEQNRAHVFGVIDGETNPASTDAGGDATPGQGPAAAPEPADEPTAPDATGPDPGPSSADGGDVDAADLMGGDGPSPDPTDGPDSTGAEDEPGRPAEREAQAIADRDSDGPLSPDGSGTAPTGDVGESEAASTTAPDHAGHEPTTDGPSTGTAGADPNTSPAGSPGVEREPDTGGPAGQSASSDGAADRDVDRTTVRITRDVGEIFGVDEREYDLSTEDVVTLPSANAEPLVDRDAAERID